MVKFIVLTTQRSGATFFLKCLSNHPQIACRHETIFGQKSKFRFFSFDKPGSFYYQYRSGSLGRQLAHWFWSKRLVCDCLDDYLLTLPNNAKAVGLKVSYNQIEKYKAIAAWIEERDVRIIHLVRNNVLKTLLSLETAKKRSLFQSTRKVEPIKVHLHPGKLKRNLAKRTRRIEKYRAMFVDKPYLDISYESFVAGRDAETRRVLQFLDIDEFIPLGTDLVKLNPDSIEDIIENYGQVAQALKGTVFEKYLTQ